MGSTRFLTPAVPWVGREGRTGSHAGVAPTCVVGLRGALWTLRLPYRIQPGHLFDRATESPVLEFAFEFANVGMSAQVVKEIREVENIFRHYRLPHRRNRRQRSLEPVGSAIAQPSGLAD